MTESIRDKTEQVLTPLKADLIWFVLLLLAVYGAVLSYRVGYKDGVQDEKIGWVEDRLLMGEPD